MGKKQDIEKKIEKDSIDAKVKVFYQGEWYLLIQYEDMKIVLKQVEENQKISYQVPPPGIREELLKLKGLEIISKVGECVDDRIDSKKEKSPKKVERRIITTTALSLLLAASVWISLHKDSNYTYVGLDYQELLDKLPDDSLNLSEVLEEKLNFQDSGEYYGSFSDSEKEEFRNRAERFASYLTEEEQELFKYQLNNVTIQKAGATNFFYVRDDSILYVYKGMRKDNYNLELAFCKMMQECYMENGKDYFIFNNQQFRDSNRVELGNHFPFYNNLLFIYWNYPEYQKELTKTLETEEALYYQLMLQVLDSNINYLPFSYQMEDILKAYQEIYPSTEKTTDLFGQIGIIQSFQNDGRFYDYERRHSVIELASEYFIEREKQVATEYSSSIVMESKEEAGEQLTSELAQRYVQYLSKLNQIDQLYPIKICEIWIFESPYKKEVIPYVYNLEKEFEMIPESMTEEEFQNYFFEKVYAYKAENEVETSNKEKQYIFHYPLSTQ